jgi:hypothetical protein
MVEAASSVLFHIRPYVDPGIPPVRKRQDNPKQYGQNTKFEKTGEENPAKDREREATNQAAEASALTVGGKRGGRVRLFDVHD